MPRSSWQPIATGALEARVRAVLGEYAEVIAAADVPARDAGAVALWWAYAGDRYGSDARREQAVDRLCESINEVEGLALHGGVVGLAWALAHVVDESADELLGELDELVVAAIDQTREYDLIEGLAGTALYFLERPRSALRDLALNRIVARLDELRDGPSARPVTNNVRNEVRKGTADLWRDREGRIDLGVAHGAPGVLAVLTRINGALGARGHVTSNSIAQLTAEIAAAIRAYALPDGQFPSFAGGDAGKPARTAWCYGDPGLSCAFARCEPLAAEEYASRAAKRDATQTGVKDAGLCHGAFGLAHIFQRWGLDDAARAWLERGLDMPKPTGTSLLEGAPGAGLALIAAVSNEDPGWGRIMAFDL